MNDAGIIELAPDNHLVVVVMTRDVAEGRQETASALIGQIARAAYDIYR